MKQVVIALAALAATAYIAPASYALDCDPDDVSEVAECMESIIKLPSMISDDMPSMPSMGGGRPSRAEMMASIFSMLSRMDVTRGVSTANAGSFGFAVSPKCLGSLASLASNLLGAMPAEAEVADLQRVERPDAGLQRLP